LPDRRLGVVIGDVAGKGMPAALLMAKIASDARSCLLSELHPERAVARLNNLAHRASHIHHRFVTLVAAVLEPDQGAVTLVNAGHLTPLVCRRASQDLEEAMPAEIAGLPVGVQKDSAYTSFRIQLQQGDSLLLFTDGVTEAEDKNNKQFRMDRVFETLRGS